MQNNLNIKNSSSGVNHALNTIPTAGLLVIEDNKLLLAYSKNKKAWYLPGGKLDHTETPMQSLIREIEEELGVLLSARELEYFYHITAPAFGEKAGTMMEQDCFIGPANRNYQPTSEIGAIRYFSLAEYKEQSPVVPGVIMAFEKLTSQGLIR